MAYMDNHPFTWRRLMEKLQKLPAESLDCTVQRFDHNTGEIYECSGFVANDAENEVFEHPDGERESDYPFLW